jgi:hypothetical protein
LIPDSERFLRLALEMPSWSCSTWAHTESITSLNIGGGPDAVAFDGTVHRIYSAGKAGKLTVDGA